MTLIELNSGYFALFATMRKIPAKTRLFNVFMLGARVNDGTTKYSDWPRLLLPNLAMREMLHGVLPAGAEHHQLA